MNINETIYRKKQIKRRWLQINKAAKWSKKSKYVQFPEIIKSGFYSIKHLDLTRRERNMFYKSRLAFNGLYKKNYMHLIGNVFRYLLCKKYIFKAKY